MSRQSPSAPEESEQPEPERDPARALHSTSARLLTVVWSASLIVGWLSHRVVEAWRGHAPVISWAQPVALTVLAVLLAWIGWMTHRTMKPRATPQPGLGLAPHQAVNRLVLARACAVVGALLAGGYLGYAVSWLGVDAELANQRLVRSALAGCAGLAVVAASLFLEWACRVRGGDKEA